MKMDILVKISRYNFASTTNFFHDVSAFGCMDSYSG